MNIYMFKERGWRGWERREWMYWLVVDWSDEMSWSWLSTCGICGKTTSTHFGKERREIQNIVREKRETVSERGGKWDGDKEESEIQERERERERERETLREIIKLKILNRVKHEMSYIK